MVQANTHEPTNCVFNNPLLILLLSLTLGVSGCAGTGANDGPVENPPNIVVPPGNTPDPGPAAADNIGNDIDNAVSKDLENTVDIIKGRNGSLPQRGVFFSLGLQELERSAEPGTERSGGDSDISNVTLGYDQIIFDSWVAGTALDLSRREALSSSDIEETSITSGSLSLTVFANRTINEVFEISGYAGVGIADISSERSTQTGDVNILDIATDMVQTLQVEQGIAEGDSNSEIIIAGLSLTHRIPLGSRDQLTLSAGADFSRITTDAFTEQGLTNSEFSFSENRRENVRHTVSGGYNRVFSTSIGVLVPAITLAYVHDKPDNDNIIAEVLSDPNITTSIDPATIDRNSGRVDLDLIWVRPGGMQFFANVNSNFDNRFEDESGVNVGGRFEF